MHALHGVTVTTSAENRPISRERQVTIRCVTTTSGCPSSDSKLGRAREGGCSYATGLGKQSCSEIKPRSKSNSLSTQLLLLYRFLTRIKEGGVQATFIHLGTHFMTSYYRFCLAHKCLSSTRTRFCLHRLHTDLCARETGIPFFSFLVLLLNSPLYLL